MPNCFSCFIVGYGLCSTVGKMSWWKEGMSEALAKEYQKEIDMVIPPFYDSPKPREKRIIPTGDKEQRIKNKAAKKARKRNR